MGGVATCIGCNFWFKSESIPAQRSDSIPLSLIPIKGFVDQVKECLEEKCKKWFLVIFIFIFYFYNHCRHHCWLQTQIIWSKNVDLSLEVSI